MRCELDRTSVVDCGLTHIGDETAGVLNAFGVNPEAFREGDMPVRTPITGEVIARLAPTGAGETNSRIQAAHDAFLAWRKVPAPKRGEFVLHFSELLRREKEKLARLVTIEAGKVVSEGLGEVQEMIDICIFAAGLSRQLHGLTIATERPNHRMMETWHPLGVVGIISAFNFPVAVWAWNATLALVCGNSVVWKPSEKTTLTAIATQALFERAGDEFGGVPEGLSSVLIGGRDVGEALVDHPLVPVVSATGSTAMGRAVGPRLAKRFARSILELGGNNAAIVCPSADLDLVVRAVAFAAMGTAGQRCTSLRRLIVHEDIYDKLIPRLKQVYASVSIGDPREPGTLVGPLIDGQAYEAMQKSLYEIGASGATIVGGERVRVKDAPEGFYVKPALVEVDAQYDTVRRETFAPILYIMMYRNLDDAIRMHNDVPQGLASSIFTNDLREAEKFLSAEGSDCGIANVNIGPSGAEIGGAFGGEKETGGGRESGSDVWKLYMRRATNTINYGSELPLAQGVKFEIGP
jgi:aldehyde dehydrogenase (NAD+)